MRVVRSLSLVQALLGPDWARALFCFALVLPSLGFVRGPQARWTRGVVSEIDPRKSFFIVHEVATGKNVVLTWNAQTRIWTEPLRRMDRGAKFAASDLTTGAEVRVQFKPHERENVVARIIRARASVPAPVPAK